MGCDGFFIDLSNAAFLDLGDLAMGHTQSHLVLQLSTPAYARSSIKLRGGSGSLISEKTTPTMDRMTEEFGDAVLDRPFTAQAKTPVHNHQGIKQEFETLSQAWGNLRGVDMHKYK
jgi:hypothetical protein